MDSKKDPGKFTVRFNIADPQQRTAAELLNQQGRCKAQFLTNAVLFYVGSTSDGHVPFHLSNVTAQRSAPGTVSESQVAVEMETASASQENESLGGDDMDSILRTMEAFKHQ